MIYIIPDFSVEMLEEACQALSLNYKRMTLEEARELCADKVCVSHTQGGHALTPDELPKILGVDVAVSFTQTPYKIPLGALGGDPIMIAQRVCADQYLFWRVRMLGGGWRW